MKELDPHTPDAGKDKPEMHAIAPAKAEEAYYGTIKKHKGQKLYEIDIKTGEIKEAEYESTAVIRPDGSTDVVRKAIMRYGHRYETAINLANAKRKYELFKKRLRQDVIDRLKQQIQDGTDQ